MTETFHLSLEQAHAYEDLFVPALFAQWAPILLEHAQVGTGDRVLDVACGTGVVARAAAEIVGPTGHVTGVDLNPAMIKVAREVAPDLDWHVGDACDLPFEPATFDVIVCQSALFFFADVPQALREMARVARPGGTVAIQTYAGLEDQPGYGPFVDVVVRHAGADARRLLGTYWSKGDPDELRSLLRAAGLEPGSVRSVLGRVCFPSVDALVHTEVQATPLAQRIEESAYRAIVDDARAALAAYVDERHAVTLPIRAVLISGRR